MKIVKAKNLKKKQIIVKEGLVYISAQVNMTYNSIEVEILNPLKSQVREDIFRVTSLLIFTIDEPVLVLGEL